MIETIIQLSTPRAVSAIHIIRVSGNRSLDFLKRHTGVGPWKARRVYCTDFFIGGKRVDNIICFYFKSPHSYTGEDMVEVHCHGSLLIVNEIIKAGIQMGFQLAAPGEFTKRAFLNGKLDLEQAEAVDVLIKSKNNYLKKNALAILEKKSSLRFDKLKEEILDIVSNLETAIEFPEQDTELPKERERVYKNYMKKLLNLKSYFSILIDNYTKGKKIDEGIKIAIIGRPNTGKSTLMNSLLREERVLVSEIKGTTRDFIKEEIFIDGFPILLYDTAGIRETSNLLEQKGIDKTIALVKEVDIIIYLLISSECLDSYNGILREMNGKSSLFYLNKIDLLSKKEIIEFKHTARKNGIHLKHSVCLLKNESSKIIEMDISKLIQNKFHFNEKEIALLNERQKFIMEKILEKLSYICGLLGRFEGEEIIIEEFNTIKSFLNELNLDYNNDEVFDKIFSKFCIGK